MDDEPALIAHLLRRTSFGPLPGQVNALAGGGVAAALDSLLSAPPVDPGDTPSFDESTDDPPKRWLRLMANPRVGLHEKLTWFWHGHFTSSYDKVGSWKLMYRQHLLLRKHALGNFRALLQAITVDPAMLVYLDGDGSRAEAPNENYGREVMELFSLGRGNYTQDDVRAGAKALSGWTVDYDTATATLDPDVANGEAMTFLGRPVTRATDVVDAACDHPACPGFVAGKLHRFLAGVSPAPDRLHELTDVFKSANLEIRPLVENILRHPSFLDARLNRPRYPTEWVTAAVAAIQPDDKDAAYNTCYGLGQVPYYPPNVAGWPPGPRWLASSYAVARAGLAAQARTMPEIRDAEDPVAAALSRCSLYEPSISTVDALHRAAADLAGNRDLDHDARAAALLGLVVSSPDFALA